MRRREGGSSCGDARRVGCFRSYRTKSAGLSQAACAGDWGELDVDDVAENEFSLTRGLRLLSAYRLGDGMRIWVITEADRSVTTLLLLEEY